MAFGKKIKYIVKLVLFKNYTLLKYSECSALLDADPGAFHTACHDLLRAEKSI